MRIPSTTLLAPGLFAVVTALGGCGEGAQETTGPTAAGPVDQRPTEPPRTVTAAPDQDRQEPRIGDAPLVETTLVDRDGKEIGSVSIEPVQQGVRLALHAEGLSPGPHAVHFHEYGVCEPPDFKSAGDHYNPHEARHGMPDSDEQMEELDHHVGDMLNQEVDDQEVLDTVMVNHTATLAEGPNALLDADGTALVIHAKVDDYESQPSGAAGDRVACAVIGRATHVGSR
jgi:Cu-Zn family superoxide dismutase